jgi:hypothetical protein
MNDDSLEHEPTVVRPSATLSPEQVRWARSVLRLAHSGYLPRKVDELDAPSTEAAQ